MGKSRPAKETPKQVLIKLKAGLKACNDATELKDVLTTAAVKIKPASSTIKAEAVAACGGEHNVASSWCIPNYESISGPACSPHFDSQADLCTASTSMGIDGALGTKHAELHAFRTLNLARLVVRTTAWEVSVPHI